MTKSKPANSSNIENFIRSTKPKSTWGVMLFSVLSVATFLVLLLLLLAPQTGLANFIRHSHELHQKPIEESIRKSDIYLGNYKVDTGQIFLPIDILVYDSSGVSIENATLSLSYFQDDKHETVKLYTDSKGWASGRIPIYSTSPIRVEIAGYHFEEKAFQIVPEVNINPSPTPIPTSTPTPTETAAPLITETIPVNPAMNSETPDNQNSQSGVVESSTRDENGTKSNCINIVIDTNFFYKNIDPQTDVVNDKALIEIPKGICLAVTNDLAGIDSQQLVGIDVWIDRDSVNEDNTLNEDNNQNNIANTNPIYFNNPNSTTETIRAGQFLNNVQGLPVEILHYEGSYVNIQIEGYLFTKIDQ